MQGNSTRWLGQVCRLETRQQLTRTGFVRGLSSSTSSTSQRARGLTRDSVLRGHFFIAKSRAYYLDRKVGPTHTFSRVDRARIHGISSLQGGGFVVSTSPVCRYYSDWAGSRGDSDGHAPRRPKRSKSGLMTAVGISAAAVALSLLLLITTRSSSSGRGVGGGALNKTTFTPFTITSREQVSPTAFIITVIAAGNESSPSSSSSSSSASSSSAAEIQKAWAHGLWSVEIKQPQLQIARHYTPLPPPPQKMLSSSPSPVAHHHHQREEGVEEGEGIAKAKQDPTELRFLIRTLPTGEMSNYLARLPVGSTVWLRGPHPGFDIARRLGAAGPERSRVVFLAGGTGIAPALQVARRVLDCDDDDDDRAGGRKDTPKVSILWANRKGVDALGRRTGSRSSSSWSLSWGSWFGFRADSSTSTAQDDDEEEKTRQSCSLATQIQDLKTRHGSRFDVTYFVDEEDTFIGAKHLDPLLLLLSSPSSPSSPPSSLLADRTHPSNSESCPWHLPLLLERQTDEDDTAMSPGQECACVSPSDLAGSSRNLLCVSGPDGFIEAYAGPKRWADGREMQGPVCGLIGRIMRSGSVSGSRGRRSGGGENVRWPLVLKL
ncbi:hypothetical protein F4778DRAFT_37683 [Xylariomycetidae sp. FL2044]|nr:hypothetical protein F4778DRAFT_37683 [Xylariomycetidae sp. FL2044]